MKNFIDKKLILILIYLNLKLYKINYFSKLLNLDINNKLSLFISRIV